MIRVSVERSKIFHRHNYGDLCKLHSPAHKRNLLLTYNYDINCGGKKCCCIFVDDNYVGNFTVLNCDCGNEKYVFSINNWCINKSIDVRLSLLDDRMNNIDEILELGGLIA